MKRFHVMLGVKNLEESIEFYSKLFGQNPSVKKEDYAKWLVDDPMLNFSISSRAGLTPGIEHLGIQAGNEDELQSLYENIATAKATIREEGHTVCCYAQSEKSWVKDPQNVEWEIFHTYGESQTFHDEEKESECCEPTCCN